MNIKNESNGSVVKHIMLAQFEKPYSDSSGNTNTPQEGHKEVEMPSQERPKTKPKT